MSVTPVTKSATTTFTAKIAQDAPGNIKFIVDGVTYKRVENGVATLELSDLARRSHKVIVNYAGNYKYSAQTKTKTFTV